MITDYPPYTLYRATHSPAQHFALAGYQYLDARIDNSAQPSDDYEDEHPGAVDAWRDKAILALLRGSEPPKKQRKEPDENGKEKIVTLAGVRIDWHLALPELKVWAGKANMLTVTSRRLAALWECEPDGSRLLDWTVPLKTASGLDARIQTDPIDVGFSLAALGMKIMTFAAAELLAIIGLQTSPIVRWSKENYGYADATGQWWRFRVLDRSDGYHRKFTMSERVLDDPFAQ